MAAEKTSHATTVSNDPWPPDISARCPYDRYASLREGSVVFEPTSQVYLVSRWEDIAYVTGHPEIFKLNIVAEKKDRENQLPIPYPDAPKGKLTWYKTLRSDGEDHRAKRSRLAKVVERDRLAAYEPRLEAICDELIDGFAARGSFEFRAEYAEVVPSIVMCDILGLPRADAGKFVEWVHEIGAVSLYGSPKEAIDRREQGWRRFYAYCEEAVLERYRHPDDGFLSEIIREQLAQNGGMDLNDLIVMASDLVTAGSETTAHLLTNAMYLLLTHPDDLAHVSADAALVRPMLEETLRFMSPVQWGQMPRLCVTDTTIGDVAIPAGSLVTVVWASGNRDASVFEDPERYFIERLHVGTRHLAFGRGIHLCVGAPLARLEGKVAFTRLFARLENFRFETADDGKNIPSTSMLSPRRVHVAFDVRS